MSESDFKIDNIEKLRRFSGNIDELIGLWYQPDPSGGSSAVPDVLVPQIAARSPNMGQRPASGPGFSGFTDAVQLFLSYDEARRELVGDPGEFATSPLSSALAAFVDGLMHLSAVAMSIYQNYDSAKNEELLSVDEIIAMLNAPLSQSAQPSGARTPS